ncbi:50S ribosomal protein L9 [uncultured Sphaerochaeta sp.]|uniref:50S ribosomal protein L9 n=1 Tax=uncultured Sphaerochaeta sp. TaxID=886478 RepID=UPI002A0A3A08|nr:50S ribosomal protein L9 [uncultured Sphaerochaeta sp.]
MKIILNQDVANLGEEGDVVIVKDGYARNYLLPTGTAVLFNRTNQALFASRIATIEKRKIEKRALAATLKEKLDNTVITLVVSAGESGKLFGSVTSSMIQESLSLQGIEVERKRIEVSTHTIKMVGTYSVRIRLYEDENSEVKLVVESESQVKARQVEAAKAAAEAAKAASKAEAIAKAEAVKAAAEAAKAEAPAAEAKTE